MEHNNHRQIQTYIILIFNKGPKEITWERSAFQLFGTRNIKIFFGKQNKTKQNPYVTQHTRTNSRRITPTVK